MQTQPTQRFSNRAAFYVRSRPTYPSSVVSFLETEFQLTPDKSVADIGSGTGLLTQIFLEHGNRVFGVEPNAEMRVEGEKFLAGYPNFVSVTSTAEATTLPDASVDAVVAGQAFHWFNPPVAKREFQRICKPDGFCALIWNERESTPDSFDAAYDQIVKDLHVDPTASDQSKRVRPQLIESMFPPKKMQVHAFPNVLKLDRQAVMDRLLSSSYMPLEGPGREAMLQRAGEAFDRFQHEGQVEMRYATRVYCGKLH